MREDDVTAKDVDRLTEQQRVIYDHYVAHFQAGLDGRDPEPLGLNVDGDAAAMGKSLAGLQNTLTGINYIITDEKSMVSLRVFAMISKRLQEAFPEKNEVIFGGVFMMLLDDFNQLTCRR